MMSVGGRKYGESAPEKKIVSRYKCNKCGWETIHTWHTSGPVDRNTHVIVGERLECKKCGSRKTMRWEGTI